MTRNRASAKQAGTRFERLIADYLAAALKDDRIDRRPKTGALDRGDIGGIRHNGRRIVIECKDTARLALPDWTAQARTEADNDDALIGLVVHKRHGNANPAHQWVAMTVADLVALLNNSTEDK